MIKKLFLLLAVVVISTVTAFGQVYVADFIGWKPSVPRCPRAGVRYFNTTDGKSYLCTVPGTSILSPGTWVELGAGGSVSLNFIKSPGNVGGSQTQAFRFVDPNYIPLAGALNADNIFSVASNDNVQNNAGLITTSNHFVGASFDLKITASGAGKWHIGQFNSFRVGGTYTGSGMLYGILTQLNNRGNLSATPYVYGNETSINLEGNATEAVAVVGTAFRGSAVTNPVFVGGRFTAANGYSTATQATGVEAIVRTVSSGATITTGRGLWSKFQVTAFHTITEANGLAVSGWTNSGTIQNSRGIYIDTSVDQGTVTSFAIKSDSVSPSTFAGAVSGVTNAYGAGWNGSAKFATEDSIYDKIESLSLGGGGSVSSVGLSLPAIFSVSGSPVTTTGTLSASLASQAQNLVFASLDGTTGTPSFRSLVAADIPALDVAKITTGTFADSFIPNLAASKVTSGVFSTARLGTGTANSTTYLRGDGTWQTVSGGAASPLTLTASTASEIPLTVNGAASQSANLQNWSVNGTLKAYIDNSGAFNVNTIQNVAPNGLTIYSYQGGLGFDSYNVAMSFRYNGGEKFTVNSAGVNFLTGVSFTFSTPASSSEACTQGAFKADADYLYVCTATNTWKRAALSAF